MRRRISPAAPGNDRGRHRKGHFRRILAGRVTRSSIVAIIVATFVVAESLVRVLEPNLPPPRSGDEQEGYIKADQMGEIAARGERIDVAFVGASGIDSGIKPRLFDSANETFTGAYNAGHIGMPPEFIGKWTHQVVLHHLEPKVVVVGISQPQLSTYLGTEGEQLWGLTEAFEATLNDLSPGLLSRIEREVSRHSALVRYRRQLRSPAGIIRSGFDRITGTPNLLAPDTKPREVWEGLVGPYGTMTLYAESPDEPLLDPEMAARYHAWHQSGNRVDTIFEMIKKIDEVVPVVILVPPIDLQTLAQSGMDPHLWDDSLEELAQAAEHMGIPIVDWTHRQYDPLDFHDKGHLADSGAIRLSLEFAAELDRICASGALRACRPGGR